MKDIVLVTAESIRSDFADSLSFLSRKNTMEGVTAGHYTRTSLASLLSSNYLGAFKGKVVGTSLAEVLSRNGYTCIGLSASANTDPRFGFDKGFDFYESFVDKTRAPNKTRQYLAKFEIVRKIYYWLNPPYTKFEDIPSDRDIIDKSIEKFNSSDSPRFLWIFLMGTHRPYGHGNDAISKEIRKKAFFSPKSITEEDKEEIEEKYKGALSRMDEKVKYLLENLDSDPIFIFTGDHGESFGEDGFYFHQPHLLKINKPLATVPVIYEDIEIEGDKMSLIDIPPTLLDRLDIDIPQEWHGKSRINSEAENALTIGTWGGDSALFWQDFENDISLNFKDGEISFKGKDIGMESEGEMSEELKERLRDLGYME